MCCEILPGKCRTPVYFNRAPLDFKSNDKTVFPYVDTSLTESMAVNSNVVGRDKPRVLEYNGGAICYKKLIINLENGSYKKFYFFITAHVLRPQPM